jgi:hypothetical protein
VFKAENLKLDFQKTNSTTVRYIAWHRFHKGLQVLKFL